MSREKSRGKLELKLLGGAEVWLDGLAVTGFRSGKARALLYYLAVMGRAQPRSVLAGLFWGDVAENHARRSLTTTLSNLRQLVGNHLEVAREMVAFGTNSPYWLDVAVFEAGIEAPPEGRNVEALKQAIGLYRGDFLEGFHLHDAPEFEQWMLRERARLREQARQALQILANHLTTQADLPQAIEMVRRLLTLEPWREEAHRQLMELLAHDGQRSAALAQYETCRQLLAEALGVEPGSETITLYEQILAGDLSRRERDQENSSVEAQSSRGVSFTPSPSFRHNLPVQPTPFVGRVAELADMIRRLTDRACRLLTLVGPGGIGKTRLALQVAQAFVDPSLEEGFFEHGLFFVPLAAVSSGSELVLAIANIFDITFHSNVSPKQQLLGYLREKEMLLILDSFEHLLALPAASPEPGETSATELVAEILAAAPSVKILVTSRETLNLQEAWFHPVEGMSFPMGEQLSFTDPESGVDSGAASLERYDAVQLFVQSAARVRVEFSLAAERAAVVRLCRLVEGMPLAIELAAAWLKVLPVEAIVAEVERGLDILTARHQNLPERHRSMRVVLEQSWQMLTESEQEIFKRLSVFRGGFDPDAGRTVAGASLLDLASFVDKSLLQVIPAGRYHLHELLRQYAAEKLWGESALGRQVWQAHSSYYLQLASRQAKLLRSALPREAIAAMRVELDNIRQAWDWATTSHNLEAIDEALDGLSRFYDLTGLFGEGESRFTQTAAQVEAGLTSSEVSPAQQRLYCRLLVEQARMLHRQGLTQEGAQAAQKATELAQVLGSLKLEALARHQWGDNLSLGSRLEAAHIQLERALQLARMAQLPDVEAEVLRDLGIVEGRQGNYVEAKIASEQALSLFEALEDRRGATITLMNLATLNSLIGDYTGVQPAYEQALQNFRRMEDRWGETLVTINLGDHHYQKGNYTAALALSQRGLQLCQQLQDQANESIVAENLGHILYDLGDYPGARRYYQQALTISRTIGEQREEARALSLLGLVDYHLGERETAYDYCQQAWQLIQESGAQASQALVLTHLGHVLVAVNQSVKAVEIYQQALALYQAVGKPQSAITPQAGLVNIALAQGDLNQALAHTEEILAYLQMKGGIGVQDLFQVYWICYQVLRANQDPRAEAVLATAHRLLQERAAKVEDEQMRRSFLENVPGHWEIVEERLKK